MADGKLRPGGRSGKHPWRDDPSLSTRPPFQPQNTASVKHGAVSHRMLRPVAERLEQELIEQAPWCSRPAFQAARAAWSWAEAQCLAYRAWFDEHGLFDEDGEPLPGLVLADRAEARASKLRARLSLDPSALASLISKLSSVEHAGGTRAEEEQSALEREVADLDRQIAEAMERRELERGE
jgi:hypothetical protein